MAANRRIIIAMSMLLVAIFASVSVTFAWFSSGTLASAIFNLSTRAPGDHLYIQIDETGVDKERTDSFLQSDTRLTDLAYESGADGRWGLYRKDGSVPKRAEYVLQSYTFYTDNPRKTVYLMISDSAVSSNKMVRQFNATDKAFWLKEGRGNEEIAKFYGTTDRYETNDPDTVIVWRAGEPDETVYYFNSSSGAYISGAANAARLMFFEGAHDTLPAGKSGVIWEPKAGEGYDVKDAGGNYKYQQVSSYYRKAFMFDVSDSVDRNAPSNTLPYSAISGNTPVFDTSGWRLVEETNAVYHSLASSSRWFESSITIALWLEGRDADCFNVIQSDTLNVDMLFELV